MYGDQHKLCLVGTRKRTLAAFHVWADNENTLHKIFYLLDIAGSGKSTVSKQVVENLKSKGRLVARFFFSRDTEETMSTNLFSKAVSNAFAGLDTEFRGHVAEFKERPDIDDLSLEEQFEGLVADPLRKLDKQAILVVDALDECNNEFGRRNRLLEMLHAQQPSIPNLRIFMTGRPEIDIKSRAEETVGYKNFSRLEGTNKDVELYIHKQLEGILPEDKHLVVIKAADGLFIWARLACDMLRESADPEDLQEELRGEVGLDDLYRVALREAIPKDRSSQRAILTILAMIMAAQRPLSIESLEMLSPELSKRPGVVERAIKCLGSLLICSSREDPIRLLHITFRDFITDQSKAGPYFVHVRLGHYALASQSISIVGDQGWQDKLKAGKLDLGSIREVLRNAAKVLLTNKTVFSAILPSHGRLITINRPTSLASIGTLLTLQRITLTDL